MGSKEEMLRIDTPDDTANAFNCIINAVSGLADELTGLRGELALFASDLRSLREQNARQDSELWAAGGISRLTALLADTQKQALQIKGLWAVLGAIIGFLLSYGAGHLR